MKTVDMTVHFTIKVPDDVVVDGLALEVDTSRIKIMNMADAEYLPVNDSKVLEYETVNVEELVD